MAEHIEKTIADLQAKLQEQEEAVLKTKQLINQLCEISGRPAVYQDSELEVKSGSYRIQPDQFYGQPLSKAVREILEMRKAVGSGPATPREIYDALIEGGYAFETSNENNRLTGLRISLRKSSSIFHRLPDGKRYGLLAWYPKAKNKKLKDDATDDDSDDASFSEDNDDGDNEQ